MDIDQTATSLFGKWFLGKEDQSLQEDIRKARMNIPADVYKSRAFLYALLVFPVGAIIGFFVGWILGLGLPLLIVPPFLLGPIFTGISYQIFLMYPGMAAGERAREIDTIMPYAAAYMYALSRSGMSIGNILRDISEREDMGELGKEAKTFRRNTQYLGQDPVTGLRNLSRSTPSDRLSDFLEVLVSIIETGGDVSSYFKSKSVEYREERKSGEEEKIATLEFFGEAFIIVVVLAPLLFLTILGIFQYLTQIPDILLMLITYGWVPVGGIAFTIMISTQSKVEVEKKGEPSTYKEEFSGVKTKKGGEEGKKLTRKVRKALRRGKLREFLSDPIKVLTHSPAYVLYISIPVAAIYLLFFSGLITTTTIVIATLIAIVPYILTHELRAKRIEEIEQALPGFLNTLEGASRSGLPLSRAIGVTSTSELGPLTDEVKRTYRDIQWGGSAAEALINMEYRIRGSTAATRASTLIRKASEAEEDISDVVEVAKENARAEKEAEDSRQTALSVYKVVLLLTFGVFLFTVLLLMNSFLAMSPGGGVELGGEMAIGGVDLPFLKLLFYHLLLEVGIFSGLIAAQLETGDLRNGMKYAVAMMVVGWILFKFIILPMEPAQIQQPTPEEARLLLPLLLGG